jgi:hypothetical protein
MNDQKIAFLPFHAINEFMRPDYRLAVTRKALNSLPALPDAHRRRVEAVERLFVRVPGFRNSLKAPTAVKVRPMSEAFEKHPETVAAILSAWAESQPDLRANIQKLLSERGWDLLPMEADRSELPGFIPIWPHGENFDGIIAAYHEAYPEQAMLDDDISLMVVWQSNRLPYNEDQTEDVEESEIAPG